MDNPNRRDVLKAGVGLGAVALEFFLGADDASAESVDRSEAVAAATAFVEGLKGMPDLVQCARATPIGGVDTMTFRGEIPRILARAGKITERQCTIITENVLETHVRISRRTRNAADLEFTFIPRRAGRQTSTLRSTLSLD
jgi:hypothetical protein